MLYNIFIITLMIVGIGGTLWASIELEQARKTGKIRVIGKVRIGVDDSDRIDWLAANWARLKETYWRLENEGGTIREAIDWLAEAQKNERSVGVDKPKQ
jgi:hypothetical protein